MVQLMLSISARQYKLNLKHRRLSFFLCLGWPTRDDHTAPLVLGTVQVCCARFQLSATKTTAVLPPPLTSLVWRVGYSAFSARGGWTTQAGLYMNVLNRALYCVYWP